MRNQIAGVFVYAQFKKTEVFVFEIAPFNCRRLFLLRISKTGVIYIYIYIYNCANKLTEVFLILIAQLTNKQRGVLIVQLKRMCFSCVIKNSCSFYCATKHTHKKKQLTEGRHVLLNCAIFVFKTYLFYCAIKTHVFELRK